MYKSKLLKTITGIGLGSLLLNGVMANPGATQERSILGQSPSAIASYFGPPVDEDTGGPPGQASYYYSTIELERLLPHTSLFSIGFVDNEATSIGLSFERGFTYSQAQAEALFTYIFGYEPTTWREIERRSGPDPNSEVITYCVGHGIANNVVTDKNGNRKFTNIVGFVSRTECR